jgi:UDP-N-acetylmuramate--alanine ligase
MGTRSAIITGTGMSAIAQWLAGNGKKVSGSDRYFQPDVFNDTREKLEALGIRCFLQNGEGISTETDLVVVSTAVEDTVPEVQKAKQLNIPIIKRAELLALVSASKKTIAIGGTSGKSTTCAMLFDILQFAGLNPSIISGAGLVSIMKEGRIGNAKAGTRNTHGFCRAVYPPWTLMFRLGPPRESREGATPTANEAV